MAIRDIVQAAAGVGGDKLYVEDVFSTYLYTGNGSTQTITNGIDLDGEGGLVWLKSRSISQAHGLFDTERANGTTKFLQSQATDAEVVDGGGSPIATVGIVPNSNGFTLNNNTYFGGNGGGSGATYASWTFRKAPKFFDVVTYTGNGSTQNISHSLDTQPGCVMIKKTSGAGDWMIWHRGLSAGHYIRFTPAAQNNSFNDAYFGNSTTYVDPTSTQFTVGYGDLVNSNGATFVAYVFAHDAGGFGDDGEQNVISCGSVVGASQQEVYLGFEPQWILLKNRDSAQDWWMVDNMRGWPVQGTDTSYSARRLNANLSSAESTLSIATSATGFKANTMTAGQTYIYIAIRRPMKAPEAGTEVYNAIAWTGNSTNPRSLTGVGFAPDLTLFQAPASGTNWNWYDRLRGPTKRLLSNATVAESTRSTGITSFNMDGITFSSDYNNNGLASQTWFFKRAPGFFDEVCDTGTGSNKTEAHNLGVVPELIIRKSRSNSGPYWLVGSTYLSFSNDEYLQLSTTGATQVGGGSYWNSTAPTSSVFSVGNNSYSNGTNYTFVNYLFATLAGVSKVGSYTGTGADLNVDCGFSAGARFILIKRTDSTGDWYVWDSVRGISAGNDPYILLNNALAQVTNTDYIDPLASGFTVTSSAPAALNASGGSYLFLAIA